MSTPPPLELSKSCERCNKPIVGQQPYIKHKGRIRHFLSQDCEGVVAPLEPSVHDLAHRIWAIGYIGPVPKPTAADEAEIKLIAKMVNEWAAAVSKNSKDWERNVWAELRGEIKTLRSRIAELEKEIAALRETRDV